MLRWAAAAACVLVIGGVATLHRREQAKFSNPPKDVQSGEVATLKSLETDASAGKKPATMQRAIQETSSAANAKQQSGIAAASPGVAQQRAQAKAMEKRILAEPLMSGPNGRTVGAIGGTAGAIGARPPAPVAPPLPSSKTESLRAMAAYQQQKEQRESAQAAIAKDLGAKLNVPQAAKQNDQVTVALAPPPETVEPKAKPPAAKSAPAFVADNSSAATAETTFRSERQKSALKKGTMQIAASFITPQWTLSSDGKSLMRSLDEGKTWDMIPVAGEAIFRAVAAIGPEVWVGGAGGVLYHSSDAGRQWATVKPVCDGKVLAADIVRIEFPDVQHLQLTTATGTIWTTSDSALTWEEKK